MASSKSEPKKKSTKVLRSQSREIVRHCLEECKKEKIFNQLENPIDRVVDRVIQYTGTSRATVHRIQKEVSKLSDPAGKLETPHKKRKKEKKFDYDDFDIGVLRRLIQEFYLVRKEMPTLRKIRNALQEKDFGSPSVETLRLILRQNGFYWRKCRSNKELLIETPGVIAARGRYLKLIQQYRKDERCLVYLDETWIDSNLTFNKCWQHPKMRTPMRAYNAKYRIIAVDACTADGFVPNARLIYRANITTGDYHGQMNGENFNKWLNQKLIPNLPPHSVIIMDNAPYHSVLQEKVPTKSTVKAKMIEWLDRNQIIYDPQMRKYELFELIQQHKPDQKQYVIDSRLVSCGHEVLRLPPYMSELNLIEFVWAETKRRIRATNVKGEFSLEALQQKTEESMAAIEKYRFQKINAHIIKIENNYRQNDAICDDRIDEIIINFGDQSESEDDFDEFWADEPPFRSNNENSSSDSSDNQSEDEDDDELATPLPGPSTAN